MKLNSTISNLLTNKWVLNVVAFLAFFNVIGYLVIGNTNAVVYFIVFAMLARFFSKNMTIVLGVPLLCVNLLSIRDNMMEGMENNQMPESSELPEKIPEEEKDEQEIIDKLVSDNKPEQKTAQGLPMYPLEKTDDNISDNNAQSTGGDQQGFETGRRKTRGNNIDYAATMEDAYDDHNILGDDGVQRLTSDTQNLMKQQVQLARAVENMTPMLNSLMPYN